MRSGSSSPSACRSISSARRRSDSACTYEPRSYFRSARLLSASARLGWSGPKACRAERLLLGRQRPLVELLRLVETAARVAERGQIVARLGGGEMVLAERADAGLERLLVQSLRLLV